MSGLSMSVTVARGTRHRRDLADERRHRRRQACRPRSPVRTLGRAERCARSCPARAPTTRAGTPVASSMLREVEQSSRARPAASRSAVSLYSFDLRQPRAVAQPGVLLAQRATLGDPVDPVGDRIARPRRPRLAAAQPYRDAVNRAVSITPLPRESRVTRMTDVAARSTRSARRRESGDGQPSTSPTSGQSSGPLIRTCCSTSNFSRHWPEPSTTEYSGFFARCTGMPVSAWITRVEPDQQRAATGDHDAPLHDVGRELRRRLVERDLHRVDDRRDRLLDRLADLDASRRRSSSGDRSTRSRPRTSA